MRTSSCSRTRSIGALVSTASPLTTVSEADLEHLAELRRRRAEFFAPNPAAEERAHDRGLLTANERIKLLLDPGSEWAFSYGLGPTPLRLGFGEIHGRPVLYKAHDNSGGASGVQPAVSASTCARWGTSSTRRRCRCSICSRAPADRSRTTSCLPVSLLLVVKTWVRDPACLVAAGCLPRSWATRLLLGRRRWPTSR